MSNAWIRNRVREDNGFSLTELLVVIAIIGVLATIAISVFFRSKDKGSDAAARSDIRNVAGFELASVRDPDGEYVSTTDVNTFPAGEFSDWHPSEGVQTVVRADGEEGFCAITKSQSGSYFLYDSEAGGLHGPYDDKPDAATLENGICEDHFPADVP